MTCLIVIFVLLQWPRTAVSPRYAGIWYSGKDKVIKTGNRRVARPGAGRSWLQRGRRELWGVVTATCLMIMTVVTYCTQLRKHTDCTLDRTTLTARKLYLNKPGLFFFPLLNQLYFNIMHRQYNAPILSIQFDEYSPQIRNWTIPPSQRVPW